MNRTRHTCIVRVAFFIIQILELSNFSTYTRGTFVLNAAKSVSKEVLVTEGHAYLEHLQHDDGRARRSNCDISYSLSNPVLERSEVRGRRSCLHTNIADRRKGGQLTLQGL